MAVTIREVAKEAGVSISTVSKVLNGWTTISPETVARIQDAIKKLHYVPNSRAVNFARGTTMNILFLAALSKDRAYSNPHMFNILCGVQRELAARNYTLTLVSEPESDSLEEYLEQITSGKIADGILIDGSVFSSKLAKPLISSNYPHMLIGHPGIGSKLCWIDTDNALAGEFAAHHMLECGYSHVAYLTNKEKGYISTQRLNGFLGGMYYYGYRLPDEYIGYCDDSISGGYECAWKILSLSRRPCAIVCENNTLALGAIRAINEKKLSIPEEIALLTFDSYPYSQIIEPTPTVVDIDVYDLGVQAAQMLLRKIENPSLLVQSNTTLPVLKQGETTVPTGTRI